MINLRNITKRRKSSRYMIMIAFVVLGAATLAVGMSSVSPKHAYAAVNCGINTGNLNDYAGAIVDLAIKTPSGGNILINQNEPQIHVNIATALPTYTPQGNVVNDPNGSTTVTHRVMSDGFTMVNQACANDPYNLNWHVILGYNGNGATSKDTAYGVNGWVLDCDHSLRSGRPGVPLFQSFNISASGTPTGQVAGGTWSSSVGGTFAPPNGDTFRLTVFYTPPHWSLSSNTKVNGSTTDIKVNPGVAVTFASIVHNNAGSDAASYDWYIQTSTSKGGPWTNGGLHVTSTAPGASNPNGYPGTAGVPPWPPGLPDGAQYCERVFYTNANGPGTAASTSAPVCAILNNPNKPPVGTLTLTCTQVTVSNAYDPDTPNATVNFEVVDSGGNIKESGTITKGSTFQRPDFWATGTYTLLVQDVQTNAWTPVSSANISCVQPTCTITATGSGPGGIVLTTDVSKGLFHLKGTITAGSYDLTQTIFYGRTLNLSLSTTSKTNELSGSQNIVGRAIPAGTTFALPQDLNYPADAGAPMPNTPSTVTVYAYADYWGHQGIGPQCKVTFNIYSKSTLVPNAPNPVLSPSTENPSSIKYSAWVANSDPGAVNVPVDPNNAVTSIVYKNSPASSIDNSVNHGAWATGNDYIWNGISKGIGPSNLGDKFCAQMTIQHPVVFVGPGGSIVYGPDAPAQALNCTFVSNEPYSHFFGSDLSAATGFNVGATPTCGTTNSGIHAYYDTTDKRGSASQFGANALGVIEGLGSASLRTSSPSGPSGLTFANTNLGPGFTNLGGDRVLNGGNYDSYSCLNDYTTPPNGTVTDNITNTLSGTANDQSTIYTNGNLVIHGLTVNAATNTSIIANNNVYIDGNINFNNPAGWAQDTDVPSLIIVSKGDIHISGNVTNLDGIYIAQGPGSTGGTIDTCAPDATATYTTANIYAASNNQCGKQLVVNGSFIAGKIKLNRTYSSLRFGFNGEYSGYASHGCGVAGTDVAGSGTSTTGNDCAAEIFNFSPELYLSKPKLNPTNGAGTYQSIISLPPVL